MTIEKMVERYGKIIGQNFFISENRFAKNEAEVVFIYFTQPVQKIYNSDEELRQWILEKVDKLIQDSINLKKEIENENI